MAVMPQEETTLLPSMGVGTGRRPVALASGYLQSYEEGVPSARWPEKACLANWRSGRVGLTISYVATTRGRSTAGDCRAHQQLDCPFIR